MSGSAEKSPVLEDALLKTATKAPNGNIPNLVYGGRKKTSKLTSRETTSDWVRRPKSYQSQQNIGAQTQQDKARGQHSNLSFVFVFPKA
jgi:hypothetical protein